MPIRAPIDEHLAARILSCPGLPTLPAVAVQVLQICEKDEVDLNAIAAVVSHDPAITAKLMRLANSASFATRGKVASLTRAVALLGTNATLGVALSFSLIGGRRRTRSNGFDHPEFWRRALFSALAGRALGHVVDHDEEEIFVACLLQDLGMLALSEVFPADYGPVCQSAGGDHEALPALELASLGADHVQVGTLLARRWNLPTRLEESVAFSHDLAERAPGPGGLRLHDAVYLSGLLADVWTSPRPAAVTRAALGAAAARLGLPGEAVAATLHRMAAAVPEAASDFNLELAGPAWIEAILVEAQLVLSDLRPASATPELEAVRPLSAEAFQRVLEDEVERSRRGARPLAMLVLRAALEGSRADAKLARLIKASLRQTDVLAREAGHYLALLVDTPESGAQLVAERIRARLAAAGRDSAVGLACQPGAAPGSGPQLLASARALLEAESPGVLT